MLKSIFSKLSISLLNLAVTSPTLIVLPFYVKGMPANNISSDEPKLIRLHLCSFTSSPYLCAICAIFLTFSSVKFYLLVISMSSAYATIFSPPNISPNSINRGLIATMKSSIDNGSPYKTPVFNSILMSAFLLFSIFKM